MRVNCPYYREHRRALRKDEGAVGEYPTWVTVPYCLHKHSTARLERVSQIADGWLVLVCGGNVDHCEVPPNEQFDI